MLSTTMRVTLGARLRQQNTMFMGSYSLANFAKYDRSKPHLNVGTIGKFPKNSSNPSHLSLYFEFLPKLSNPKRALFLGRKYFIR